jgi:hypothetical protein
MKKRAALLLTAIVCSLGLLQSAHAQGSGCPAEPSPAWVGTLGAQVLLSPGIPEGVPRNEARGVFEERRVKVTVDPATQRVILSSTQFTDLCVDDVLELTVWPAGVTWRYDFRTADGQGIKLTSAIDISAMFGAGEQTVTIKLIDLVRPQASASPIWLSIIPRDQGLPDTVQIELWKGRQPTLTQAPTPTLTPWPTGTPTRSPAASPTTAPEAIITHPPLPTAPAAMPEVTVAPPADKLALKGLPVPWSALPLALMVLSGLGVWLWKRTQSRVFPQGDVLITLDGKPLPEVNMPIDLASFKKLVISVGGGPECDIRVYGEGVPSILLQFRAERNEFRLVETLMDRFDPLSQEVVETVQLRNGDELFVQPITLAYTNYAEQEPIYLEGGYHV